MSLLLSLTAFAQVKTGGGPDGEYVYSDDEFLADQSMNELLNELQKNDEKCSKEPRIKYDKNIVQIYLKLTLLQNSEKSSELCEEANKYIACVNTKATSNKALEILATKNSTHYLGKQLNINKDEMRKILIYFADQAKKKK